MKSLNKNKDKAKTPPEQTSKSKQARKGGSRLRSKKAPGRGGPGSCGGGLVGRQGVEVRVVADVWKKDVWDFQAKSSSSGFLPSFPSFPRENRSSKNVRFDPMIYHV